MVMDGSQYHSNPMSTSGSSYSPLPLVSPQQLQHNPNLPPHTLPPLQQSQHAALHLYGSSGSNTPRTPTTPNTPGPPNTMSNYPQMGGHMGQQMGTQPRNYQMMPVSSYPQQPQQYRPTSMLPQASASMAHPQPIAPAPVQHRMPQTLRPMPPNGLQHLQPAMPSSTYGQSGMMSQPSMLDSLEPPTHVVGSQGRRGILPSAPGRPTVSATGTGSTKNAVIPAKDADGKFPCPHCTKTYLHAKHLKRHLLRHTGDRPYMCVLCRDTFSRSDILKRHFQKCSIRRGNPTGASHLSHAQAHVKKSHPGPHKTTPSMPNENDMMGPGMSNLADHTLHHPFGAMSDGSIQNAGHSMTAEQADQLSRSNSLKRLNASGGRDGRSMMDPGPGGSNRAGFDQSYAGGVASTMPSGMNPSVAFSMPHGQNGHSYSQNYDFAGDGSTMQPQSTAGLQGVSGGRVASMPAFSSAGDAQLWPQVYPSTTVAGVHTSIGGSMI